MSEVFPLGVLERCITDDPMKIVSDARMRGAEPQLVTGHDSVGDSFIVAWFIPDTNQLVIEGIQP